MACHGVMMFTKVFKYRKKVGELGFWLVVGELRLKDNGTM
jgi:hypothetical protein